ncbi:gamma-glutamyltranspeptidase 1-like protein [Labeo rohita]|uniref:Gamma-glutamyltranspeptidase 1-like protein n=1 Tax=Labeo rohita TaxID=84645 RepID=A0A498NHL6_LABRO|nr:gamma-glutamyltranspeptidase 1-like protein [Labeo rohita]
MVVGGAGGTNITTSVAQVILNYLFFGYDLQKAVKEPRVQITINETDIEEGFDKDQKMEQMQFKVFRSQWCVCEECQINGLILIVIISLIHSLRPSEINTKTAVAADAETCSEIGRDILKRKGSAVDAAIATLLCVSLVNAQSVGIGGGGVFTIYNASTGKVETINARETAPMGASENVFGKDPQNAKPGTPGLLRGYELAHKRHGRLQWKELFEPSIKLAREGFHIGWALASAINETSGTILNNAALCSVSSTENKTLTYHRMIEAFRFANARKSKLGDPLYEDLTEIVKRMTSENLADDIRSKIKDDFKQTSYYEQEDSDGVPEDHGTSHLSVLAEDGSAVAVTSSINNYFGSGVMSRSGIIFNDQMRDFIDPELISGRGKNNLIKPGKRPLSSMCPTIILDKQSKQVKMVVGGSGGTNITTSVAQVILNYLFFGYDLQKAVKEPRVQIRKTETIVEDCFDESVIDGLMMKKHTIYHNASLSVVQAIVQDGDKVSAESDPRNYGYPAR